ncbi:MAG: type II secretion system protein [Candidatus Paceibacterota bacterium]|jgi:prepilin-type N-terminal cleavage/methylation domain-containing protein
MIENRRKGFTLIELLVVVAIIGLLATVIFAALSPARLKGRDAKRKSDAHQIILAIELYFNTNGTYPTSGGATAPNAGWSNSSDNSWTSLATQLSPFLGNLAKDPNQSADPSIWGVTGAAYSYVSCGPFYMFVYRTEEAKGPDPGANYCGGQFYRYGGAGANTFVKTIGNSY